MAKILIVDDSNLSRRVLRSILELESHDVIEASDGTAAIERYCQDSPDLVLLDLVMTGLSGLEVLAKLKELDANVRVVVATADTQTSTRDLTRASGACCLVTKPFQAEEVLEAVRRALNLSRPLDKGVPT